MKPNFTDTWLVSHDWFQKAVEETYVSIVKTVEKMHVSYDYLNSYAYKLVWLNITFTVINNINTVVKSHNDGRQLC